MSFVHNPRMRRHGQHARSGFHPSLILIDAIEHKDPDVSSTAMRGLGLICFSELGEENQISGSLIRLFEHYAQYGASPAVRRASLDALFDCGALRTLTYLSFANYETERYRDALLESAARRGVMLQ